MAALISEVSITEDGQATTYAGKLPTGFERQQFLQKIIEGMIVPRGDSGNGRFTVPGVTPVEIIDRKKVTSMTVTMAW
jgi:hypothetical protein